MRASSFQLILILASQQFNREFIILEGLKKTFKLSQMTADSNQHLDASIATC